MSNKKQNTKKPANQSSGLMNLVVTFFLLAMFAVFPLFVNLYADGSFPFIHFDDGFYGIRHQKYYFFIILSAVAVIAEALLLATSNTKSKDSIERENQKALTAKPSFTDWAVLALVVCCAISTIFSSYRELAFWGEVKDGATSVGRNNGLFLILFYCAVYFIISRWYRYNENVFTALAVSCGLVYLLTVLNGYHIDPLHMYVHFLDNESIYTEFFSTIGNKNMLSSFICVTLPAIIIMSVHTKSLGRRVVYICSSALGSMAIIIGDSDSALLGIGVFFVIYLIIYARNLLRLRRFLLTVTVMLASVKLLRLFSLMMNDNYKKLGEFTKAILFSGGTYGVILAFAAITAAVYLLSAKKPGLRLPKAVPIAIGGLFGAVVLGAASVVFYFSVIDTESNLGSLSKLLRMNDAWGTHRGIMWLRSFKIFGEASFFEKLFGTGPDTFYFAFKPYFGELLKYGNSSTDAAHNEYINYLITIGIFGLGSYLAFAGGALARAFKAAKRNPIALVAAASVLCYLVQAVVNIALPISTPLLIIFASICEANAKADERLIKADSVSA